MTVIGTPYADDATRVLLLGSGELGKEVAIELQRLGCEVIAVIAMTMPRPCRWRTAAM
ncbi:hypothetical protein ULG90_23390 [Halopseudomonas pachastrellae]|nr:hypothetical protein ULG90_23390 [Halopseudomonas pachastrellae]